jgi:hypothetical protein
MNWRLTFYGEIIVTSVSELSTTLFKKVEVGQFISEMTHKLNVLRFWVKI